MSNELPFFVLLLFVFRLVWLNLHETFFLILLLLLYFRMKTNHWFSYSIIWCVFFYRIFLSILSKNQSKTMDTKWKQIELTIVLLVQYQMKKGRTKYVVYACLIKIHLYVFGNAGVCDCICAMQVLCYSLSHSTSDNGKYTQRHNRTFNSELYH